MQGNELEEGTTQEEQLKTLSPAMTIQIHSDDAVDASTPSASLSLSLSPPGCPSARIPSQLFKNTYTDSHGYLLPPVSNPDLHPTQLERADSFWIGPEETRLEGEKNLEQRWVKEQQNRNRAPNALAPPLSLSPPISTSKTRNVLASALLPSSASHATHPSTSFSPHAHDHLLDEDDWSAVLDATVFVAKDELGRSRADDAAFFSSSGVPPAMSLIDSPGQKRKHHPLSTLHAAALPPSSQHAHKQLRLLHSESASRNNSVELQLQSFSLDTPQHSAFSAHSSPASFCSNPSFSSLSTSSGAHVDHPQSGRAESSRSSSDMQLD
jgi:hypothetical protein